MIDGKTVASLTFARAENSRLPKKALALLWGKPLIAYTCEQAQASTYIDRVIISTDSQEIADACIAAGVAVPKLRDADLCQPKAIPPESYRAAPYCGLTDWLAPETVRRMKKKPDICIVLYAESPLRSVADIDRCIELLAANKDIDRVEAVSRIRQPHSHAYYLDEHRHLWSVFGFNHTRQDSQYYQSTYYNDGGISAFWTESILKYRHLGKGFFMGHIVPWHRALDIDTPEDLEFAEAVMQWRKQKTFVLIRGPDGGLVPRKMGYAKT